MVHLTILAAVSLAVAAGAGGPAQAESKLRLAVDLTDGSLIIGAPSVASFPIQTPYARMDIPLSQVISVTVADDHENAAFELANGDHLQGVLTLGPLKLATVFGNVSLGVEHIRGFRVLLAGGAFSRKGLVLWNRLGSEFEVTRSSLGPGGKFNAGRFVEGRFGKGIELNMQEQFGVTFPPDIVPGPDGCIEFWAKLADFPADIRQPGGSWPGLIAACDRNDAQHFLLCFCANDGSWNGGICARVAGLGSAGTGQYGSWTYARALNSNEVNGWHHYALVWATAGIPGVEDGERRAAVYLDGKLNTGFWGGGTGDKLAVPTDGRFGLLSHQGTQNGRVVFDNLKIWNYAKTDFGDRTEE